MTAPFRPELDGLVPYEPGRPVEIVQRELGIAGPIVKLASNEGPWGPVPAAIEAIVSAARDGNRYPDGGCYALRSALAERHGLAFGQVVVGNGADGVLNYLALALLEPGDEVAFCWPSFPVYPINAAKMGAVAVRAPLAGSSYDLEALAAVRERAHEARLRHQSEQPDGRHGDARGARALPGRPAGARPAGPRRGLLRVHRRSRSTRTARASSSRRGGAASCCARSRRSTGWRASGSATGSARPTSPRPASRSRTRST